MPSAMTTRDTSPERSITLTPLETEGAAQLRGPDADLWRTLAAWLWMAYLMLMSGAVLWWLF